MTLDLAKIISYLNELQKSNNQNYITPEGLALLEGVVLAGNGKAKVIALEHYVLLEGLFKKENEENEFLNERLNCELDGDTLQVKNLKQEIRQLKSKIPWWNKL